MNTPTPSPPIAHTHRGKPRTFVLDGHHAATKPARTPKIGRASCRERV